MMRSLNSISAKSFMSAQDKWNIWLRCNERDLMNQDPPTHWFCFYLLMFLFDIFLLKLFFICNIMDYFLYSKINSTSSQQVKCSISLPHGGTVNAHCYVIMGRWYCLGNYVMSQWVGDIAIDTKQSCDQQLGSIIQDPGKPGSFTKIQVVWKYRYFT